MVTNAEAPTPDKPTKEEVYERIADLKYEAETAARTLLTGDANGRVRRNLLFVVVALALVLPGLAPVGLVALLLLALTDMVIV